MTFHPDQLQDLNGQVYIVTGATSGIGLYTAARLAEHGAHVYICARSPAKASAAKESITKLYSNAKLSVLIIDHNSLASVNRAAQEFKSQEAKLHGLVNNAGIMCTPFEITGDGYEAQWQTNYLAHWLLTQQLLPLMLATSKTVLAGTCRIVNVSSSGHMMAPSTGIEFNDTSLENGSGMNRYGQSKLANILHMKSLHKAYGPGSKSASDGKGEIWVSSVEPGLVKTQLGDKAEFPMWLRAIIWPYVKLWGPMDPDTGAWTNVFCVASRDFRKEHSGVHFGRIAKPNASESANAKKAELVDQLDAWTREEMVKGRWTEK